MNRVLKVVLQTIGVLTLGIIGAFVFEIFLFPYILTNNYFSNFQFVKNFKNEKVIIQPKEQVYIQENSALEDAVKKNEKLVVAIQAPTQKGKFFTASGLIVTSDGLVVTLASLLPQGNNFKIFMQGQEQKYQVLKRDVKNNLALIKLENNNLPTSAFADSLKINLGQRVFLIGFVSEKADSTLVDQGIIINFDNQTIKTNIYEDFYANGTPLFNIYGELVGLNYVADSGQVSAIGVEQIKTFLNL
jgi:S1-C subfamily serine protease